mgnify:FL=1
MGWKTSMVIVNNYSLFSNYELLHELGYQKLKKIGTQTLEDALYPKDGELFIGRFKNNIIICETDLAYNTLNEKLSNEEFRLNELLKKNTEICGFVLHSGNNIYGYSISQNSKRIRVKAGSSDDGIIIDVGQVLQEEQEVLNEFILVPLKDGFQELKRTEYAEDQIGEDLVFNISKRYFGERLDLAEDKLFNIKMTQ